MVNNSRSAQQAVNLESQSSNTAAIDSVTARGSEFVSPYLKYISRNGTKIGFLEGSLRGSFQPWLPSASGDMSKRTHSSSGAKKDSVLSRCGMRI